MKLRKVIPLLWLIFPTLLFISCASTGPSKSSPEFAPLVTLAIPQEFGAARVYGSGAWYSDVQGFEEFRSAKSMFLGQLTRPIMGVMAITDDAVFFLTWDQESEEYNTVKRLLVRDILEVTTDSYGRSRMLVLHNADYTYESFSLEPEEVEEAVGFLQGRVQSVSQ